MATRIYKYPIGVDDTFSLRMHRGARVLCVQLQRAPETGGDLCVWAMVDTDAPLVERTFALRGTGHDCTGLGDKPHVGTFQLAGGAFVGHLFDLGDATHVGEGIRKAVPKEDEPL